MCGGRCAYYINDGDKPIAKGMKGQASPSAWQGRDISPRGSRGLDLTGKYVLGQSLGAGRERSPCPQEGMGVLTLLPAMEGGASGHREAWSGTPTGHHQLSGVRTAGWQGSCLLGLAVPSFVSPCPANCGWIPAICPDWACKGLISRLPTLATENGGCCPHSSLSCRVMGPTLPGGLYQSAHAEGDTSAKRHLYQGDTLPPGADHRDGGPALDIVVRLRTHMKGHVGAVVTVCLASTCCRAEVKLGFLTAWISSFSSFPNMVILGSLPNKYSAQETSSPLPSGIQNCDESDKIAGKMGLTTEGINFCSGWK